MSSSPDVAPAAVIVTILVPPTVEWISSSRDAALAAVTVTTLVPSTAEWISSSRDAALAISRPNRDHPSAGYHRPLLSQKFTR